MPKLRRLWALELRWSLECETCPKRNVRDLITFLAQIAATQGVRVLNLQPEGRFAPGQFLNQIIDAAAKPLELGTAKIRAPGSIKQAHPPKLSARSQCHISACSALGGGCVRVHPNISNNSIIVEISK